MERNWLILILKDIFFSDSIASFGPPLVSVDIENNSAIIKLKGPMRYQPDNHTPAVSMATLYPQMMYNLSIRNSHRSKPVSKSTTGSRCFRPGPDRLLNEAHLKFTYNTV